MLHHVSSFFQMCLICVPLKGHISTIDWISSGSKLKVISKKFQVQSLIDFMARGVSKIPVVFRYLFHIFPRVSHSFPIWIYVSQLSIMTISTEVHHFSHMVPMFYFQSVPISFSHSNKQYQWPYIPSLSTMWDYPRNWPYISGAFPVQCGPPSYKMAYKPH